MVKVGQLQTDCWHRKKVFKYRSVENAQSVIMTDAQVEENFEITDYSFINASPADGTDVESCLLYTSYIHGIILSGIRSERKRLRM